MYDTINVLKMFIKILLWVFFLFSSLIFNFRLLITKPKYSLSAIFFFFLEVVYNCKLFYSIRKLISANLQVKTQIIWILLDRGFKIIFQEITSLLLFFCKISRFYNFYMIVSYQRDITFSKIY